MSGSDAASGVRGDLVAREFELEAATCEAEFACGARDVAFVLAEGGGDHVALKVFDGDGERDIMRDVSSGGGDTVRCVGVG